MSKKKTNETTETLANFSDGEAPKIPTRDELQLMKLAEQPGLHISLDTGFEAELPAERGDPTFKMVSAFEVRGGGYGEPRPSEKKGKYDSKYLSSKKLSPAWSNSIKKTYQPEMTPGDMGVSSDRKSLQPSDSENFDVVRESLIISVLQEPTNISLVVVDTTNEENNSPSAIRCYGGIALGGYCHDLGRDAYLVRCVDFLHLGSLPFVLSVSMPMVGEWRTKIPIPEKMIDKHMSPEQRKLLGTFQEKYPSPRFNLHFIQMLGCHV